MIRLASHHRAQPVTIHIDRVDLHPVLHSYNRVAVDPRPLFTAWHGPVPSLPLIAERLRDTGMTVGWWVGVIATIQIGLERGDEGEGHWTAGVRWGCREGCVLVLPVLCPCESDGAMIG
jgi:hypothetical protein